MKIKVFTKPIRCATKAEKSARMFGGEEDGARHGRHYASRSAAVVSHSEMPIFAFPFSKSRYS